MSDLAWAVHFVRSLVLCPTGLRARSGGGARLTRPGRTTPMRDVHPCFPHEESRPTLFHRLQKDVNSRVSRGTVIPALAGRDKRGYTRASAGV
jgi:hypothetical protein